MTAACWRRGAPAAQDGSRSGGWLDSYRLVLSGEGARYGALWSEVVAQLSRPLAAVSAGSAIAARCLGRRARSALQARQRGHPAVAGRRCAEADRGCRWLRRRLARRAGLASAANRRPTTGRCSCAPPMTPAACAPLRDRDGDAGQLQGESTARLPPNPRPGPPAALAVVHRLADRWWVCCGGANAGRIDRHKRPANKSDYRRSRLIFSKVHDRTRKAGQ